MSSATNNGTGLAEEEDPEEDEDEVSGSGSENGEDGASSRASSAQEEKADFMIDSNGSFLCPLPWTVIPICPDFWTEHPKAQAMKEVKRLKYRLLCRYDNSMSRRAVLKKYLQ